MSFLGFIETYIAGVGATSAVIVGGYAFNKGVADTKLFKDSECSNAVILSFIWPISLPSVFAYFIFSRLGKIKRRRLDEKAKDQALVDKFLP